MLTEFQSNKLEKIRFITDAVAAILVSDELKRRYLTLSSSVKNVVSHSEHSGDTMLNLSQ